MAKLAAIAIVAFLACLSIVASEKANILLLIEGPFDKHIASSPYDATYKAGKFIIDMDELMKMVDESEKEKKKGHKISMIGSVNEKKFLLNFEPEFVDSDVVFDVVEEIL